MGKVTLPHKIGGFMTYLHFCIFNINHYNSFEKHIKCYTNMSPYVSGDFIPSQKDFYTQFYKRKGAGIVRGQYDASNYVGIGIVDVGFSASYDRFNVLFGVEDINDIDKDK